jgi:hypothetical protein
VIIGLGVLVFTGCGLVLMALGHGFLTFPLSAAKWLILSIETAATLSIGATLAAAYLGGRPDPVVKPNPSIPDPSIPDPSIEADSR